jgi:DnaJ-class molecular chaperone
MNFDHICEAYEVLSDEKKKAIFDANGEFGLKNGVRNENGDLTKKYVFLCNSDQICRKFH